MKRYCLAADVLRWGPACSCGSCSPWVQTRHESEVQKALDADKIVFADKFIVIASTGIEPSFITPVSLPKNWKILIEMSVLFPYCRLNSG